MSQLALSSDSVAVITGGASGIGLAAAMRLARMGLRVCIADLGEDRLAKAAEALAAVAPGGRASIMAMATDVSRAEAVERLEAAAAERFGVLRCALTNVSDAMLFPHRHTPERLMRQVRDEARWRLAS